MTKLQRIFSKYGEEIAKKYKEGATLKQLQDEYGLARDNIRYYLKKYFNVRKLRDVKPQNYQRDKILELEKKGYSLREIAKIVGTTYHTVSSTIYQYKIYGKREVKKKSTGKCKRCGRDKGVNRWYCDECLAVMREDYCESYYRATVLV